VTSCARSDWGGGIARSKLVMAFPWLLAEIAFDLVDQNRPAPAMMDGGPSVPNSFVQVCNLVEQDAVVEPRQLCNNLLHNCILIPDLGKAARILEIANTT